MIADTAEHDIAPTRRRIRERAAAAQQAAHAARRQSRARWLRRRGVALVAMAAVPALAVPLSFPSPSPAVALAAQQPETVSSQPQSLTVGDRVAPVVLDRDGFSASVPLPDGAEPYAFTAATFVNDPASPVQWPFTTGVPVSSPFGYRIPPCSSCSSYHNGVDLTPGMGTSIQAMADGVVTVATDEGGSYGTYVVIQHEIDGQLVESLYAHLIEGSIALEVGERVRVGQLVGLVGNTGLSTGAHLHFEVRPDGEPVDPFVWLPPRVRS